MGLGPGLVLGLGIAFRQQFSNLWGTVSVVRAKDMLASH